MSALLLKTERVLKLAAQDELVGAVFIPEEGQHTELSINAQSFEDMGRPEVITVTIVPGDELNA